MTEAWETSNHPVVFKGLSSQWPAAKLWRGAPGLERLKELCGDRKVQVMVSREKCFVGDMQHLMLLDCSFEDFLDNKLGLASPDGASTSIRGPSQPPCHLYTYLAQCPIAQPAVGGQGMQPGPLHQLMADIVIPKVIDGVTLNQINFWASTRQSRSSLHYDPYQNLLVVVEGAKTIHLAPPRTTPYLHAQPPYHQSANHSPADLEAPDMQRFPCLALALPHVQSVTLQAGDAMFIPEGWWHQVGSEAGTLAVNFWWESSVAEAFGGGMDRYYFRRLVQSLLEKQKQRLLDQVQPADLAQLAVAYAEMPGCKGAEHAQQGQGAAGARAALQSGDGKGGGAGAERRDEGGGEWGDSHLGSWWEAGRAQLSAWELGAVEAIVSLARLAMGANTEPGAAGDGGAQTPGQTKQQQQQQQQEVVAVCGSKEGRSVGVGGLCQPPSRPACTHQQNAAQHAQQQLERLIAALTADKSDLQHAQQPPGQDAGTPLQRQGWELAILVEEGGARLRTTAVPRGQQLQGSYGASGCEPGGQQGAVGKASQALSLPLVLLALRERSPAALRWVLLEGLTPLGWELMLGRLEAAEAAEAAETGPLAAQERFAEFYDRIYSVCKDGRERLLGLMLRRKEEFAQQAMQDVLRDELSVHSVCFSDLQG